MVQRRWIGSVPSAYLVAGVIGSSAVAMLAAESGWFVLASPLVMAVSLVVAALVASRVHAASRRTICLALVLGAALVLAGAMVALRDPARVATLMPILAGGAAAAAAVGVE